MKILALVLIISILVSGCTSNGTVIQPVEIKEPIKGVSISPKSTDPADFIEFISKASSAGKAVTWAGKMNELTSESSAAFQLMGLAGLYGFKPIIITQIPDNQLDDEIAKENYRKAIGNFALRHKPNYIGLGNEINRLPKENFAKHMKFYDELYDIIKEKSPDTKVFTVFQLENMKGLNGGLFGGTNSGETQWSLLESAKKYDIIAFTTYPALVYKDPSEIPEDYYTEIKTKIFRPIAFTEIGWFKVGPPGWESSEEEQASFIRRFGNLTADVRSEFNIWPFLYDQKAVPAPFDSAGLIGSTTAAWDAWLAL